MSTGKILLNYLGQLRLYSILDLFVFATALSGDPEAVFGIILLWISFLLYLEAEHRDHLRLRISRLLWLLPFLPSFFLVPWHAPILFALFCFLYTLKKRVPFFAATAPLWRGLQNATLAFALHPALAFPAFALIFIRNLIADFRDSGDDLKNGTITLPVRMGFRKNLSWAFYGHLLFTLFTTYIWFGYSFLPSELLLPFFLIQILTYSLTPRSSNPGYLNFYREFERV